MLPDRSRIVSGALALVLSVEAMAAEPPNVLAQRRAPPISLRRARATFDEMERAYRALRGLDVQPGDASGSVGRWDRAWSSRLAAAERATRSACGFEPRRDCESHERYVLLCGTAGDVSGERSSIYMSERDDPLVDPFAWRRAVADEAARRGAAGLSCEDMPFVSWDLHQGDDGRFYTHDGRSLRPGDPDERSTTTSSISADASVGASAADRAPLTADEIRAGLARAEIDRCHEVAFRPDAADDAEVRVEVVFLIDASGGVAQIVAIGEGVASALLDCIESQVRRVTFRASPRPTRTRAPFVFRARDGS